MQHSLLNAGIAMPAQLCGYQAENEPFSPRALWRLVTHTPQRPDRGWRDMAPTSRTRHLRAPRLAHCL